MELNFGRRKGNKKVTKKTHKNLAGSIRGLPHWS